MYSSEIHILGLCETFLTSKHGTPEIEAAGYSCVRCDRSIGSKGGIAIYIKQNVNYVRRSDVEDENIESVWTEVHLKSHFRLLCGFIYWSPSEKSSWIINFEKQLFKAKKVSQNLILVGDFNMNLYNLNDHLRWGYDDSVF